MSANDTRPTAYIVDDDEAIRTLWRWLMESNGIAVQTFATAAEFIASYRAGGLACLVLDVRLPGMSGLELQEYLKREGVEIPIVFVSGHGDVPTAVSALKGGAVDFIQKPFSYRDVLTIIQRAFERDAEIREKRARRSVVAERIAALTEREREVMHRVVEGKLNKVIADELGISVKTVEFHRAKVMEKMGADSVAALVQLLMQQPG
ncbi:response regulator transcription factor [Piscinibacter sp.]|uniref:response regulator transcription factor n=1 Tax=Piscinibacter sp. TaxID=1903157 RepID=UPI002B97522A|nr:response regulator [Albitalea sp.]HUG22393.1 response regulator [Albitalea sp.]